MTTIELPEFWLVFDPDGVWDGSCASVSPDGVSIRATAEQAHAYLSPIKRRRDAEIRKGWTIRGGTRAELQALVAGLKSQGSEL